MNSTFARRRRVLLRAIAPLLVTLQVSVAWGAPHGGTVVAGSAAISNSGNTLLVHQSSNRAIINWTDFSIDSSETVRFVLPSVSSAVLNRVTSLSPSELNGALLSNGRVYLINPNGIMVGPTGRINVQGFTASTLDANNAAFLAGGDLLFSGSSIATVANQGVISAPGGDVVLIARQVRNDGQIIAPGGSVTLAAGTQVFLQQTSSPGMTVRVVGDGSATNSGVIQTTLAQLAANGGNAFALAINNTGVIRATGVRNANGHIYLTAGPTGAVKNSGTLDASSSAGPGGEIVVTGQAITIDGQSQLVASGPTGGGEIFIGGSWEGADPTIAEALSTTVMSGAVLDASATQSGDGGTVVVRSDASNPASLTRVYGSLLAMGGPNGGSGGRVETSGYSLDVAGAAVSASASNGRAGEWLLDPYNVTISGSATSNMNETGTWQPTATATINVADINTALNGGSSVTIYTGGSNGGGDLGNIIVNAAIAKTSGATAVTLTLEADNNITVNQSISASSGELNIVLDSHFGTSGVIILGSNLSTNGGNISFGTGRTSGGALIGGDVYLDGGSAQTLTTGGGSLTVHGQMLIANPSGLTIATSGGAVDFESTVDSGDSYAIGGGGSVKWDAALIDAKGATGGAAAIGDTYLATITSSLENQIAANAANYLPAWLGGHRPVPDPNSGTDPNSQNWYWVTGPEGTQNGGTGLAFFHENFTGGGGTAIGGAFTNWNGGEPNNSGGANTTVNGESAMEFVGTTAVWNDLAENSSSIPYVVETNLAPSAMTINAGAGQVTFKGLVGSNKALASLTVTGPVAMNGGGVTTTGAQTYNNPMTLGSSATILSVTNADLNIGQNITWSTGSAASLTLQASGSVILASNTAIAGNVSGALNVTLDTHNSAGTDSGNSGAIVLNTGASIQSHGGTITLGGGVSPGTTPAYGTSTNLNGINLIDATLSSAGGAITLTGTGGATAVSINDGVLVQNGSVITTTSGGITITGTGGAGDSLHASDGISFSGTASAIQSTGSAPISLAGVAGTGSASVGIRALGPTTIGGSSDSGNITVTANTVSFDNSGAAVTFQSTAQLLIQPQSVGTSIAVGDSAAGTLSLGSTAVSNIDSGFSQVIIGRANGTGAVDVGNATFNDSVTIRTPLATANDITVGGTLSTLSGTESITLQSGRSVIVSSGSIETNDAAVILNADSNAIHQGNIQIINSGITTGGGAVTLGGGAAPATTPAYGLNAGGSVAACSGVFINAGTITSDGGNISIIGTGSTSGTATDAVGVMLEFGSALVSGAGTVHITGVGPTGGASGNMGVNIRYQNSLGSGESPVFTGSYILTTSTSANGVVINATGSTSGSTNSAGFTLQSGSDIADTGFGGGITINGISGTFFDNSNPGNHGINLDANTAIESPLGNVTLNASSPAGLAAINNYNSGMRSLTAGGILTLNPANDGAILDSTVVTVSKLLLTGSGAFTLTDASNLMATLAAGVAGGNVQVTSGDSFSVGAIGGTTGVTGAGGTITLVATGATSDITLSDAVSGVGSGSTVVIAAGRNFINDAGSSAITAGSGRFLVYSTSRAADSIGSLVGGNIYGETYAGNPPSGIIASGNQFIFSTVPALTFTANDATKMYNQANPAFSYAVSGLLGSDTIGEAVSGLPSLSTTATSSSGVGNYAINAATGSLVSSIGYSLNFVAGNLSVTQAPLTITAQNASKNYRAPLPTFTAMYTGFVNGDTSSAISNLSFASSGTAASNVGAYSITPHGATSLNYSLSYVAGTLTISKSPLTITADDKLRPLGAPNPALTASFNGLAAGDLPSAITGLVLTTSADINSPIGTYPIDISGGSSGNYTITLADGTLQVSNIFTQDLRSQAQSAQTLAPNFPPDSVSPLTPAPTASQTAEFTPPPETGLALLGSSQGYIFYRDTAPMRNIDSADLSIGPDAILIDAIAHVSSFDLGRSKKSSPTVANDLP